MIPLPIRAARLLRAAALIARHRADVRARYFAAAAPASSPALPGARCGGVTFSTDGATP